MLDLIKNGVKLAATGVKSAKLLQAKLKAAQDDIDLDGKPEWQEIKEAVPVLKAKALDLFDELKAFGVLVWGLVLHIAEAGNDE